MFVSLHVSTAVVDKLHRTQVFHLFIHTEVLQDKRKKEAKKRCWPLYMLGERSTINLIPQPWEQILVPSLHPFQQLSEWIRCP
jgi:hypothetical protein